MCRDIYIWNIVACDVKQPISLSLTRNRSRLPRLLLSLHESVRCNVFGIKFEGSIPFLFDVLVGCWSAVSIRRIIYTYSNVCPFDYTAAAVSGKVERS